MPSPATTLPREYLYGVKESAFGTIMTSPVAGTDSLFIRLTDGNAFGMDAEDIIQEDPFGGGLAISADAYSDHYEAKGALKTKLYPSQAALLMAWLGIRGNAGKTLPWTTTDLVTGDLASMSLFHAVQRPDGTYEVNRYAGVKCLGGKIEVSRQSTSAMLSLDLQAARQYPHQMDATSAPVMGTDFPAPTEADFSTSVGPYTFKQSAGLFTAGSVRTSYESLSLDIKNVFDAKWFETSYLQVLRCLGRAVTLDSDIYLKATPDDRTAFQALTAQAVSLGFNNGTHSLTINMNGNNHITKVPYDLPLDKVFMRKLSLKNKWDASVPGDLSIATT